LSDSRLNTDEVSDDSEEAPQPHAKGSITSKIKHAIKLKTSPARVAGLVLRVSFIACFILLVIAPLATILAAPVGCQACTGPMC